MDDRLARLLLEDNILSVQKRDSGRISLLEKLATVKSVDLQTLPVPGETEPPGSNVLDWQNVFMFDEFVNKETFPSSTATVMTGQLGWLGNADASISLPSIPSSSPHYGIVLVENLSGTDGYIILNRIWIDRTKLLQFVVSSEAMIDAGDGCVFGLADTDDTYEIDGSSLGVYFRREYTETNWQAVTTDGAGTTTTDTGVAFVADTWFLFEIKQPTTGTIEFYINQILVATHTTNITTDGVYPVFGMKDPGSTMAFGVKLDYFAMQLAPIIQRWD